MPVWHALTIWGRTPNKWHGWTPNTVMSWWLIYIFFLVLNLFFSLFLSLPFSLFFQVMFECNKRHIVIALMTLTIMFRYINLSIVVVYKQTFNWLFLLVSPQCAPRGSRTLLPLYISQNSSGSDHNTPPSSVSISAFQEPSEFFVSCSVSIFFCSLYKNPKS